MMNHLAPRPYSLLAEVTHRCPLHCPYCSNPTELASPRHELTTDEWKRVLDQAAELGVLHVGFSGGEPLQRADLTELVAAARAAGLYSNLITSSLGLNRRRAEELKQAGLDSVQISFQSDQQPLADGIAGVAAHTKKLEAAQMVRDLGFPLTINVVLHRANIERLEQIISLAESLGAQRLELANTQYYGWAFRNRAALLPTRPQVEQATEIARLARQRLFGKLEILFVLPDYYSERPKPCMHGWGNRHLTVNPVGDALPCPTAGEIKGLRFENVRQHPLAWLWRESESLPISRHRLDARSVPQLSVPRGGLRRLPVPGRLAHGQRGGDGPGLLAFALSAETRAICRIRSGHNREHLTIGATPQRSVLPTEPCWIDREPFAP